MLFIPRYLGIFINRDNLIYHNSYGKKVIFDIVTLKNLCQKNV